MIVFTLEQRSNFKDVMDARIQSSSQAGELGLLLAARDKVLFGQKRHMI